ncbi:MAG: family 16 glycosylhydrolase [Leptospira sp.]|nr:family 16 glycosylhydrolase [Leptospira sp.]NCS93892.1 family 16 glycosylhydrolase [Leptospira sp.]
MTILLWVCISLVILLSIYSLGHYLCVIVFLKGRSGFREFNEYPDRSVAVLIPARNEGEGTMRVIRSVLSQDHKGPLEIYLLLKDRSDSSIPLLASAFPDVDLRVNDQDKIELLNGNGKKLVVAFTGYDSKSEKLNWMTSRLTTDYLSILDSDHQANPEWIRSSICLLQENKSRIIQGRRSPLSALGFFQLWDSLHQHIGCELFNVAFTKLKLSLFFTGTTVVMETGLLQEFPLSNCITEDAEFSYRIILKGEKIIYNPFYGSVEEVSPNMFSFLSRRRRWANGHTNAFFSHMDQLSSAPLSVAEKLQFIFHGVHYLIALFVFFLHLDIGLIILQGMLLVPQIAALLVSLILGTMIARKQRPSRGAAFLSEIAIIIAWVFPAVVIIINLSMAFIANNLSQAAIPIPYTIQALGLISLCAPLVVLIVGLAGFRQLSLVTFIWVILTYPIAFYLDVMGVLIGLVDFITNRQFWHVVARSPRHPVPEKQKTEIHGIRSLGIKDSLRILTVLRAFRAVLSRTTVTLPKLISRLSPWLLLIALLYIAVSYTPSFKMKVAPVNCKVLEHDTDPWILHPNKIAGYCESGDSDRKLGYSKRTGNYLPLREDSLSPIDTKLWDQLDSTHFCNAAHFNPGNVIPIEKGGVKLQLRKESRGDRNFTAGSIASKDTSDAKFLYGRFEVIMKPVKTSGVITAFFLYRFDPWQEIDVEFLGRDTSQILLNVFYNPGDEGDLYNYGFRGTPVIVDLGFDAAEDFHKYAIEWDAEEIRWFVDDILIHHRSSGSPTPIPHLPMRFYLNVWPTCSEELAGPFISTELPVDAEFKSVSIFKWKPSNLPWLSSFLDKLFPFSGTTENWRDNAEWIQPRR